jgi:hypothetical protein
MTWLLAYLLFGFVIHWCCTQIFHLETNNNWRWELAATVLWPVAAICGAILFRWDRRSVTLPDGGAK